MEEQRKRRPRSKVRGSRIGTCLLYTSQESVSTIIEVFSKCLYAFGLPFFCRLLYSVVPRKDGKFWTAVIGVSCYFLFGMTIFTNDMFNVTLDLLWFTALMLVAFKGRALPKLASVAIFYPLVISLNFLIQDLLGVVYLSCLLYTSRCV